MSKGGRMSYKTIKLWAFCSAVILLSASAWAEINVTTDRSLHSSVEVKVGDLKTADFEVMNQKYTGVYLKESTLMMEKGKPALPIMSGLLMISGNKKPQVEILNKKFKEISVNNPVVPSRGAISRSVDPTRIPFRFGAVYKKDAWFPADKDLVTISEPFIFREIRGVRLQATPVQYNPVKNKLRVYSHISAKVKYSGIGKVNVKKGTSSISRAYAPIYKRAFLNYSSVPKRMSSVNENGRLIIIAADEFYEAAKPLKIWKLKCGIETILVSLSEIGQDQASIKGFLQAQYDERGFTHVILVGDAEQVPTNKGENEKADSDPVYVKLAGDDHVPDAIISRISASTAEDVSYQVAKIINYEQYPDTGDKANWYTQALGIASNEGDPPDFDRMEELRKSLMDSRFTKVDKVYAPKATSNPGNGGYPYPGNPFPDIPGTPGWPHPHFPGNPTPGPMFSMNRSLLKDKVFESVNAGCTMINYIGHGSSSKWVTSGFNNQDCEKLKNNWQLPVIWSVACINGDFVGKNSFCEAWMNAGDIDNPKGAVAIFGSTTNQSWVPPCKVQAAIVSDFIVNDAYKTVGAMATNGIIEGLKIYGPKVTGEGVKMMEQWHLFGDGTTMMRTRVPTKVTLNVSSDSIEHETQVKVQVLDSKKNKLSGIRVTCYSEKFDCWQTVSTNKEGVARINIGLEKGEIIYITVVGQDIVPVVDKKVKL